MTVEKADANNEYVIRIRDIAAVNLDQPFTVQVDGTDAVTYTPLAYCFLAQSSENEKLANTAKALYLYWQAAEAFL